MMVISWMGRPLAKEIVHTTIVLQMIVISWMGRPLAKKIVHTTILLAKDPDHLVRPAQSE